MNKILLIIAIMFGSLMAVVAPASALDQIDEKNVKVDVCHVNDVGDYKLINVSENAFRSHVDHGDSSPGDAIPNMSGYRFAADCSAELIPVPVFSANIVQVTPACTGVDSNWTFQATYVVTSDIPAASYEWNGNPAGLLPIGTTRTFQSTSIPGFIPGVGLVLPWSVTNDGGMTTVANGDVRQTVRSPNC